MLAGPVSRRVASRHVASRRGRPGHAAASSWLQRGRWRGRAQRNNAGRRQARGEGGRPRARLLGSPRLRACHGAQRRGARTHHAPARTMRRARIEGPPQSPGPGYLRVRGTDASEIFGERRSVAVRAQCASCRSREAQRALSEGDWQRLGAAWRPRRT
eukprot:scaffold5447_cov430-Prasinococcus_capsulatus_cf.AAC.1